MCASSFSPSNACAASFFFSPLHGALHPVEDDLRRLREGGGERFHAVDPAFGERLFLAEQFLQQRHQLLHPAAAVAAVDAAEDAHHVEGGVHLQVEEDEGELLGAAGDLARLAGAGGALAVRPARKFLVPHRIHARTQFGELRAVKPEHRPHRPLVSAQFFQNDHAQQ